MKLIPLCLLLLLFGGCKKTSSPSNGKIPILGKWLWEGTSGGFAGTFETPSNTGVNKSIEFRDDGTYLLSINKMMPIVGSYNLNYRHCIHEDKHKMSIRMSGFEELTIEEQTNNSLILAEEFTDGFTHQYKK